MKREAGDDSAAYHKGDHNAQRNRFECGPALFQWPRYAHWSDPAGSPVKVSAHLVDEFCVTHGPTPCEGKPILATGAFALYQGADP